MSQINASEISFIAKNYDNLYKNNLIDKISQNFGIKISQISNIKFSNSDQYHKIDSDYRKFVNSLNINKVKFINFQIMNDKEVSLIVKHNNNMLKFIIPSKKIIPSRAAIFIFWLIFTSSLVLVISIIFVKNQIKFLKQLKESAEKYGRGQDDINFRPGGSEEIRSLGLSFVRMHDRIKRQVTQRTEMLSGVSHDLRTPLTRIKLQLAMMAKSKEIDELKVDIEDMENLIEEYLEFAKTENIEKPTNIAISEFLQKQIINPYIKIGKLIKSNIELDSKIHAELKVMSLKRALTNLLDNAFNFANLVEFKAHKSNRNLIITIEDNGPGIPLKERKNVMKPFYQIDNSRNLDKKSSSNYKSKGSGLGLAIANDNISSQGGRIKLTKSQLGGLKVIIYLPL